MCCYAQRIEITCQGKGLYHLKCRFALFIKPTAVRNSLLGVGITCEALLDAF
jgi:hypothetical protein